ncbi:MAG: sigma factor-like helix-turn-helix DNA-binding protein [Rhodococcus sp. (in: high G+C Gram-positive bacteria)]
MPAENPVRRAKTAKEMAARLGVSERTIRNVVAEPRAEFEARAEARRRRAVELREQGLKYREIAEEMGISTGAVGKLLHDARMSAEKNQQLSA